MTLSTQAPFLEDAERWEREYCGKADTAYRIPDKAAAAAAAAAGGAATPSRRVPAVRRQLQARPIEHPLWRNKRGTEVGAAAAACLFVWVGCVRGVGVSWLVSRLLSLFLLYYFRFIAHPCLPLRTSTPVVQETRLHTRTHIATCVHTHWLPLLQVAAELTTQPPGSALFRPAMKPTLAERLCHISLSINLAKLSTGPLILNVDIKEAANKPPKQVSGCPCGSVPSYTGR